MNPKTWLRVCLRWPVVGRFSRKRDASISIGSPQLAFTFKYLKLQKISTCIGLLPDLPRCYSGESCCLLGSVRVLRIFPSKEGRKVFCHPIAAKWQCSLKNIAGFPNIFVNTVLLFVRQFLRRRKRSKNDVKTLQIERIWNFPHD